MSINNKEDFIKMLDEIYRFTQVREELLTF